MQSLREYGGKEHTQEELWRTGLVCWGEGGIYAPGEIGKVPGARFVWPCTTGQGRGIAHSGALRSGLIKVRSLLNVKIINSC